MGRVADLTFNIFRVFLVSELAPSPVLRVVVRLVGNKQIVAYHFNGIQLTVKLWQEKALMARDYQGFQNPQGSWVR